VDRDAVVRSVRTGRRTRARRRRRHRLRLSPRRDFRVDSNATLRPRVAGSSGEELELLRRSPAGMGWGTTKRAEQRISFVAGNLDLGPRVVSFQHRPSREVGRFTVWRSHAQASSGDVQPRASAAFDRKRSHGFST